ncbi:MAG: hypothetical protein MRERV_6c007 [Mycoplasmataceae bacterium RV_VA103A]|nr:MAG: hypothetical protein MRERV_6c007 [Mycoplasmataceae bacterium RV_VA103A]
MLIVIIIVLWNKFNEANKEKNAKGNKIKRLEKNLREKENENRALKKEMCQECKKIYVYSYPDDELVSFDENPNKNEYFSLIEEIDYDYKEMSVCHLNSQWIFINFWGEEEKDYLIDLIGTTIYLPISKWEKCKRDDSTSYKILCSNRKIHLDFSQLL